MPKTSGIRIFADVELVSGAEVELNSEQSHYLLSVMRLGAGSKILVFNGRSGEFECELGLVSKKVASIRVGQQTREFVSVPDIWLLFAPLKKDCTDFVIEKAVELGVAEIVPVITRYSIADKVKTARFAAQATEAAEQSRRLEVPKINEPIAFNKIFTDWDAKRTLYYMDETGNGMPVYKVFANAPAPAAFLIGPEGGFSEDELNFLRALPFAKGVNLGRRILRAETAALSALACWQAMSGDWQ